MQLTEAEKSLIRFLDHLRADKGTTCYVQMLSAIRESLVTNRTSFAKIGTTEKELKSLEARNKNLHPNTESRNNPFPPKILSATAV